MSVPIHPWIIRPDGTLVIEHFCRYGTEDCQFFTVDSLAWPTGSFLLLRASYMTCTNCDEIELMARPSLWLPPAGYAVYHVIWKRPPSPDVDGRIRTLDIRMVANSRRMAHKVTFGKWRGISTVPGARCFIDGEEYDNGRPSFARCLVRLGVDTFPKAVMQNPFEPRDRRSQRDYSLPFKLAVVGEVGRGELSYNQTQRRYGIQGRTTVLTWCRRYASQFVTFQAVGPTSPGAAPTVDLSPAQRIKQLETALREQKRQYGKQLKDSMDLNLLLRTMLQVVEENHGIPLPKKSSRRPFAAWGPKEP